MSNILLILAVYLGYDKKYVSAGLLWLTRIADLILFHSEFLPGFIDWIFFFLFFLDEGD